MRSGLRGHVTTLLLFDRHSFVLSRSGITFFSLGSHTKLLISYCSILLLSQSLAAIQIRCQADRSGLLSLIRVLVALEEEVDLIAATWSSFAFLRSTNFLWFCSRCVICPRSLSMTRSRRAAMSDSSCRRASASFMVFSCTRCCREDRFKASCCSSSIWDTN